MSFVYPEFLYAFLVLLIPIIIHLFQFKRFKVLYFSSNQFLKAVTNESKSTQKLKHIVILALRLLAFSALVLAFAQPFFPSKQGKEAGMAPIMAFYLDNTFSMSAQSPSGSLLQKGKQAIQQIIDNAPPDAQFLMVTNDLKGKEQRLVKKSELLDYLDIVDYTSSSKNLSSVLSTIKNNLNDWNHQGQRYYFLLSDFQETNSSFEQGDVDTNANMILHQLAPQNNNNLYIDSIWFETPLRKINLPNTLSVRVVNTSNSPRQNVELTLSLADRNRSQLINIPSSGAETATFTFNNRTEGLKKGYVEIDDDQLYFDDRYYFSYKVKNAVSVTIINGTNAKNFPRKVYETDDFYKVTELPENQIQLDLLKRSNVIVLNELTEIPSGILTTLNEFTASGGSLIIIPSDDISVGGYNTFLAKHQLPLFGNLKKESIALKNVAMEASFFAGVFESTERRLNLPKAAAYFPAGIASNSNHISLVSFDNDLPYFAKKRGDENIFIFYSGVNESFGSASRHALFSTLLLRSAEFSMGNKPLALTLGQSKAYPVENQSGSETIITLTNEDNSISLIPPSYKRGGFHYISMENEDLLTSLPAGNYFINIEDKTEDIISVNYPRKESILRYNSLGEMTANFKNFGVLNVNSFSIAELSDIDQITFEKAPNYWRILLILALFFFLLETLLLKIWKV